MDHKYHIINYGSINSFPCKNYSIIYVRNFNHFAEKIEEGAKFMPYKGGYQECVGNYIKSKISCVKAEDERLS